MPFNSFTYLLFLPVAALVFHLAGARHRWLALLAASLAFYAAAGEPLLFLPLGLVAGSSWLAGLALAGRPDGPARLWLFGAGLAIPLLALAGTRYLPVHGQTGEVVAWLGVSYFVLQAISYLADVYLKTTPPERHFGHFALSLCFFPKLLQGPIERAGELLPQLKNPRLPTCDDLRVGLLLIAWGAFKKVVIADRLALFVDPIYADVERFPGLPLLFATYLFALQLYADFSGYTDMALGSARLFGVRLTQNFDHPYRATSVADFWRRWHISLSRWLLDYVFRPLQMALRDHPATGTALALFLTFLASGVWHGARWGFVVWGLLHGVYLAASTLYRPLQKRLHQKLGGRKSRLLRWWQVFVTFHLVCLAWIFFRSPTLGDAWFTLTHLFAGGMASIGALEKVGLSFRTLTEGHADLLIALASLGLMAAVPRLLPRFRLLPPWFRWLGYAAFVGWFVFLATDGGGAFLYARF